MNRPDPISFAERLKTAWAHTDSLLCVGIDPDAEQLPAGIEPTPAGLLAYSQQLVDATAAHACAFKPQVAYFAALGAEAELAKLIAYIRQHYPLHPVILDAKRGDIGATAVRYAREAFVRYDAHALTVNPYMGMDTIAPYTTFAGRGVVVLCHTSNPGAKEFQDSGDEAPLYLRVALAVARLDQESAQPGNCALVAGATQPAALGGIRIAVGSEMPLLVPGIGAQGGDLEATLAAGLNVQGEGLLINVSRAIGQASLGRDWQAQAQAAARDFQMRINQIRNAISGRVGQ